MGGDYSNELTSAELYNPAAGTWSNTGTLNTGRADHTATLLLNGKVLVTGGFTDGFVPTNSAELYDPASGLWTVTASMAAPREDHTATLLPNGRLLVAGDYPSAELYDVGLGFTPSRQPQIATFTSPLILGGNLTITGSAFRGISEASGGNSTQDSPADYPLVQLRSVESGQTAFLPLAPGANWSSTSSTSTPVNGFPPGWALATVFVNGIPSASSIVNMVVFPVSGPTYDPAAGFSPNNNTGAWRYGYFSALGSPFFQLYTSSLITNGLDIWNYGSPLGSAPLAYQNPTTNTITNASAQVGPGAFGLLPGSGGYLSDARLLVPTTGQYHITGSFFGQDTNGTTTDVHILTNNPNVGSGELQVFGGNVTGFGPGTGPSFDFYVLLSAGDYLDFAVGYGTDNNNNYDSTGLSAQITVAPFPIPLVTTTAATGVGNFSATLNGTVFPNYYQNAGAQFQYGTTTNYGNLTSVTSISATNLSPVAVSNLVSGLSPGTLYHYRLTAANGSGTGYGADMTFTTLPPFTNINAGLLPGVYNSSVAVGDFYNDSELDILLTGTTNGANSGAISQVWRNPGNGTFTNINAGLPGVNYSSVALGDFYNDGKLDILLTGTTNGVASGAIAQIWRNLGNGVFTNINANLPGVFQGSVACGDFDNDGKLDILVTGTTNGQYSGAISQIWRNLGNGVFTNINANLPGVFLSSVAVGDFYNDGRLDILLTGGGLNSISQVWRNVGNGIFTNINAGLPAVAYSSAAVGDFDNDGKLDILLTGLLPDGVTAISQVWRNLGNGAFTNINAGLPGVINSSVALGDFDNDGKLDILLTGYSSFGGSSQISQVWRNLGNGTFTNINASLSGVARSSVAWGDFNNDGRLDILLTGLSPGGQISQVWQNFFTPQTNNAPTAPTGLTALVTGSNSVLLSWNAASDAQTPASGLDYNIRAGSTPGGFDIVSPEADPATGMRLLPQLGNAGERLFAIVTNLTAGATFYWSVQAVDTAFAGSPFAAEQSFIGGAPPFHIQPASPNQVVLSWPSWATNFVLQSRTNLAAAASWQPTTNMPTAAAGWLYVTNDTPGAARFYRLRTP